MSIFETAARKKFRFVSVAGNLTAEQLWDLPLLARNSGKVGASPDLDSVARAVNSELKSITEDSFVETKPDARKPDLEVKLELVKHIISVKQTEAKKAENDKKKDDQRRALVEALGKRENEALNNMSKEDILAKLAELDKE